MAVIYSKWSRIYLPFPFQDPPKFTKIRILGLKIYHLATLVPTGFNFSKLEFFLPEIIKLPIIYSVVKTSLEAF
jgi:hypothetical protein